MCRVEVAEMARPIDAAEFEELYAATARDVLAYVRRRSVGDVEDVVAEVYVVAWRRRADLPAPLLRRAWLFGVARTLLKAEHRRRQGEIELVGELAALPEPAPATPGPTRAASAGRMRSGACPRTIARSCGSQRGSGSVPLKSRSCSGSGPVRRGCASIAPVEPLPRTPRSRHFVPNSLRPSTRHGHDLTRVAAPVRRAPGLVLPVRVEREHLLGRAACRDGVDALR